MSGSLIKVNEATVSSATPSVTITGIDSTYDVYVLQITGLSTDVAENLEMRVTESGTENSTFNYDRAAMGFKTSGSNDNNNGANADALDVSGSFINATTGNFNATIYIFNATTSTGYTFFTFETSHYAGSEHYGNQGGGVFTSTSSVDGLFFQIDSANNIDSGTFTLYGLKK